MKFTFVPEYRFDKFDDVTAEFLLSIGVKGILLDIDNTLEPYEHPIPGAHVVAWLKSLSSAGIKAAFVSNNNQERLDEFNKELRMVGYSKAGKPFTKNITTKENTIFMGDQILTDVWAAHNAGIKAILVPPINDRPDPLTKFKRVLEKPILKKYDKIHREDNK